MVQINVLYYLSISLSVYFLCWWRSTRFLVLTIQRKKVIVQTMGNTSPHTLFFLHHCPIYAWSFTFPPVPFSRKFNFYKSQNSFWVASRLNRKQLAYVGVSPIKTAYKVCCGVSLHFPGFLILASNKTTIFYGTPQHTLWAHLWY